jgi:hypothetical protein
LIADYCQSGIQRKSSENGKALEKKLSPNVAFYQADAATAQLAAHSLGIKYTVPFMQTGGTIIQLPPPGIRGRQKFPSLARFSCGDATLYLNEMEEKKVAARCFVLRILEGLGAFFGS